jgi:hypothetical protein
MDYKSENRENIAIGDEFFITYYSRHRNDVWDGPFPVTKVTATQFVLGGKRFMRSTGYEVGDGNYARVNANRATPEFIEHVNAMRIKEAAEKMAKKAEQMTAEMKCRTRYGAADIFDDDVQALLGKLRFKAEVGRRQMKELIKVASEASPKKGWNLKRELDWNIVEKYQNGILFFENARELHQRLVDLYNEFEEGRTIRYKLGDLSVDYVKGEMPSVQAVHVLKSAVKVARRKAETEFFGHRYDDKDAKQQAEWVRVLRDIDDMEHDYPSIRAIKEEV